MSNKLYEVETFYDTSRIRVRAPNEAAAEETAIFESTAEVSSTNVVLLEDDEDEDMEKVHKAIPLPGQLNFFGGEVSPDGSTSPKQA